MGILIFIYQLHKSIKPIQTELVFLVLCTFGWGIKVKTKNESSICGRGKSERGAEMRNGLKELAGRAVFVVV